MSENESFILQSIRSQIHMGFQSIDEIAENILEEIEDNGFEGELSRNWALQTILEENKKHIEESKSWDQNRPTKRLIKAFEELCASNIIALHNAGYTTSDGEQECAEVGIALKENGYESDGYCFYHEQDLERALDNDAPSLHIAFQKFDNNDEHVTIALGKKIVDILNKNDLNTIWNGSPLQKIEITPFLWQRRYGESEDLWDLNRTLRLLLKHHQ